jgi:hypothetical protein
MRSSPSSALVTPDACPSSPAAAAPACPAARLPVRDGIVIALNRLNRILRLDPAERIAVVEPGVINLAVTAAAAPHGLHYAPDPSSQSICTIGGNVAFNSGGAHCLKYGMTVQSRARPPGRARDRRGGGLWQRQP